VQGGDVAVCGELEVECQPGGAAGKVAGDVDVRVVACVGGDDVVDGVGDSGTWVRQARMASIPTCWTPSSSTMASSANWAKYASTSA
jgi:hypothetical protein